MPAKRARKGDRRIDAAIDHFAAMGYAARDVRTAVANLLELYGGPSAWPLLEDGSYLAVQEKLFEEEEEEKQKQEQPRLLTEEQQVEEEPTQQQESADEAPPEINDVVPAETESADKEVEDPVFIEPSPIDSTVQLTGPIGTLRTREPCYGWISESDDEEELTGQRDEVMFHGQEEICDVAPEKTNDALTEEAQR